MVSVAAVAARDGITVCITKWFSPLRLDLGEASLVEEAGVPLWRKDAGVFVQPVSRG
jgi:hypothetical protein